MKHLIDHFTVPLTILKGSQAFTSKRDSGVEGQHPRFDEKPRLPSFQDGATICVNLSTNRLCQTLFRATEVLRSVDHQNYNLTMMMVMMI
jgi:hypothetical protein